MNDKKAPFLGALFQFIASYYCIKTCFITGLALPDASDNW